MKPRAAAAESKTILVAFDWFDHRVYRGIGKYCIQHHWHLAPYFFSDRHLPESWPGDGAITCFGDVLGDFILGLDMPKVDVSVRPMPQDVPRVTVDNEAIGRVAADHFLRRGFRQFAFFSWRKVVVNQLRKESFFGSLRGAGIGAEALHVIEQPDDDIVRDWPRQIEAVHRQLLALPRPLAVFTGQDSLGVTLIEICKQTGISVPEEIAILGVDNLGFQCECAPVPLSSIDCRLEDLGYAAADQLNRLFTGEITMKEAPRTVPVGPVVTRRSTDSLAVEHPGVLKALELMKREFARGLVLEDVMEHAGLSKRGLEKAFRKHLGRSPASELRRMRLEHAKQLLARTDVKVDAVAADCGYSNSSNLSQALNRETGMSPNQYRAAYRSVRDW
ncbi:MAG: helix-turn-helix domain-containing protein [Akkermansiaceae bacterium]|nr:helix-turn-helix domain-containing protein [Akkermansiaceae bacterium]MCP5550309.1 helix-turn-helix domain-containing protein [Akkermansiaceae bacterium]